MVNKKKTLFLFTGIFPYSRQEAFIENEIAHLSASFDRVILVPQSTAKTQRDVPQNVEIFPLPQLVGMRKHVSVLSNALTSFVFWSGLKEICSGKKPFHRLRTLISYVGLAKIYSNFLIREFNPNCEKNEDIYLYSYWLDRGALAMVMFKTSAKPIKTVSRVHGFDVYEERSIDDYLPLRLFLLEKIDVIFSISSHAVDYLKSKYPSVGVPYSISRLGTTREMIFPKTRAKSTFSIVSVSNVIPLKRVGLIFESILKFASTVPHVSVKWTHFGDGVLFNELASNVESHRLPNLHVDLRGGQLNKVIKDFYATNHVDLFINLSESEGIPVSFMEAMSFGIPILATNVGGVSEIVSSNCGWLVQKAVTTEHVASVLLEISENHDELDVRSKKAMCIWEKHYNADVTYPEFCRSLLGERL